VLIGTDLFTAIHIFR